MDAERCFVEERLFAASYDAAMERQNQVRQELVSGERNTGMLLFAEHAPVITMGRRGKAEHLKYSADELAARGITFHEARRGGDVTYHGPGQITMYPVFPLEWWVRDLHWYLRQLEEVGISYLHQHGMLGQRKDGLTGVWVGEEKICAIGIAVSNWITYYGLAMNVQPDLSHFDTIVPCGISDKAVTSLHKITGKNYNINEEMATLGSAFCEVFTGAQFVAGTNIELVR